MIINKLSKHVETFINNISYEIAAYSYNELGNILETLNENKLKQNFKNVDEKVLMNLKNSIKAAREAAEKAAKLENNKSEEDVEQ
jgi:hypothetical protein